MARQNSGEMPFLDHLEELRWRIIWSLAALIVGTGLAFLLLMKIDVIGLLEGPIAPYLHGRKLVYTHPGDPFSIVLNASMVLGVVIALPFIIYQLWAFVSPALYRHEKKVVIPLFLFATFLFLSGVALAFFVVLPLAVEWLMSFQTQALEPMITANEYFGFATSMALAFGLCFELPIVILALAALGIVTPQFLNKYRRHALVVCVIVGAFLTPGDLVWTTIAMAVPLYLLYELSVLLTYGVYRRRQRREARREAAEAAEAGGGGRGTARGHGVIWRGLAAAVLVLPGAAMAQGVPTVPVARPPVTADTGQRRPGVRVPGDTSHVDTSLVKRDLVQWNEPDSVMNALMNRPGYTVTRYQGHTAVFDAGRHALDLAGQSAVQRDQTVLVADTIFYNDSARIVRARAAPNDTIVLRDPAQGTSDLVALGGLEYDIMRHKGIAERLSTSSAQAGQTWFVASTRGAVKGDTTGHGHNTSYALEGSVTSCDLPDPHYHFQSKEIKIVSRHILVARPAVLYIEDIPVMWLPFIFQDMRTGRRSGIIPPRFGLSDIVRTSANYHREVDNLGYYFAINNYMDATTSFDWRSGNSTQLGDVGWTRWNGEFNYRWLDRFLSGRVGVSYSTFSSGQKSLNLSWSHQQQFSQSSSLNASINYSSNTTAIRQQAFNVAQALAAIASSLNFQQALGPANVSIGGTRTQYTGRTEIDQNFPNLSITTKPVSVGSWLLWSPQFSLNNTQNLNMDAAPFVYTPGTGGAAFDSVQVKASQRNTTASFQTPVRIFGFTWQNNFTFSDKENDIPQAFDVRDFNTGALITRRMYAKSYLTSIDWQTGITLPTMMQSTLKLSPFISIVNADPSSAFWVRSQLTGGQLVTQSKTLQYGLSASPTFFGFYPGFGPFTRIRHSISPRITFTYAPAAKVSDEFLRALNKTRGTYLGGLAQENVSLQLDQVFEAKLKSRNDTNPDAGAKIKLLSVSFDPLSYDFERARKTGGTGFNSPSFGYRVSSDLLPGFDLAVRYSLFQGDLQSDTAQFKPFRTGITASFSIGKNNNPLTAIAKIFGAKTTDTTNTANNASTQALNQQPNIAGPSASRFPVGIPTGAGWTASFQFSSSQSRPIPGARVYDPRVACQVLINDPINYNRCLSTPQPADTLQQTIAGGQPFVTPALTTLRANTSFSLTPKWALQWSTGYDFQLHQFSDQDVGLQRDMHDWRAIFHFSRAPNGNFAFSFFIALKAEPDLKFDYNRSTYRPQPGSQ